MLSLYEILKASKTGIAPDMWTALTGRNWGGADLGHEIKELAGIPPLSFTADGTPLLDYTIYGNMGQTGTPTPTNPIQPSECGDLETTGTHAGQYKIPISSANTTTPVYLGEVQTTRKIKKLVLTGEEIILRDREREGSWRFFTDRLISAKGGTGICSHFEYIGADNVNNSDNIGFSIFNNAQFGCRCPKSIAATAADFKSYLAQQYANGTPVTVWYVLATEETGIVNEPLRKIGDYADTVSYEQAAVQIPTNRGNTVIDVLTELKPSEMYIKYQE